MKATKMKKKKYTERKGEGGLKVAAVSALCDKWGPLVLLMCK